MPIIVAGKLTIKPNFRNEFIEQSIESIAAARKNNLCLDFAVSPDPINENRVNVFEKWKTQKGLEFFRNSGPESNVFSLVESFDINEYEVN